MTLRHSCKRWHPYLDEWVIIAPTTSIRPWSGALVSDAENTLPDHDPECYLCPGVKRAGGQKNPEYSGIFVFDNDFPSLTMSTVAEKDYYHSDDVPALGICRVVCFSPKHTITLAEMSQTDIEEVLRAFSEQFRQLSSLPDIQYVLLFENKGTVIGVSNPHPHGQIYATDFIPKVPAVQYARATKYKEEKGQCLFCDVLRKELAEEKRIVCRNDHFAAFVPYFARYTFEVHIMPLRHVPFITDLTEEELKSLAALYREVLIRYDNLYQQSFPNITIFRNAPCANDIDPDSCHFYIEFCPPLRSSDKLKYMAGFETGCGNIINPSLPAESAAALRSVSATHYLSRRA